MMNPRPLSMRNKVKLLVGLTFLAWATQLLFHQWGLWSGMPDSDAAAASVPAAPVEHFVPQSALLTGAGTLELRSEATVYGSQITVKQLCRWSDTDVQTFAPVAELVVARFDKGITSKSLSVDDSQHDRRFGREYGRDSIRWRQHLQRTRGDAVGPEGDSLQQWIDQKQATLKPTAFDAAPTTRPILASTVSSDNSDAECSPSIRFASACSSTSRND